MALNSLGLGFVFTARDMASPAMARLGSRFGRLDRISSAFGQRFTAGMRRLRTAGLAFAATGALGTVAAFGLARAAGNFQQGLARVAGVTRATEEQLAALRDRAIEVGITTSFSPDQAVEGLGNLATMGFQAEEAMRLIGPASALAEGGMIGIADASRAVASATRVFGLSMDEAEGSADRLLRITQLTALQAGDLSLALGTVARGAGQTRQNLDEMLIAMGLVRNTGVEVSVAASSVSSSLQFMARNASEIQSSLGVAVTDAEGNFRNFLDVVLEAAPALEEQFPNAAERASESLRLFGRFGVTAFNAVATQLRDGIRGANGELLRGAAAVDFLRSQMANATGVADEFRERILSTFPGQLQLLQGSLQTLAIVLGENFARAFAPIAGATIDFVNTLIEHWNAIPSEIRDGIASFIVGASAMLTLFGTFVATSAALALVVPLLKGIAIAAVGLALALSPLLLVFGAAVLAVQALRFVWDRDLGGIATFFRGVVDRIRLGWTALRQLFTRGGFSRAISDELRRSENQGLRTFVIGVFGLAFRLQRFWDGLMAGLRGGMLALGPTFDELLRAFRELLAAFGLGETRSEDMAEALPVSSFTRFGQTVGRILVSVVRFVTEAATSFLRFARVVVEVGRGIIAQLVVFFGPLVPMVRELWTQIGLLVGSFSRLFGTARAGDTTWTQLVRTIGVLAGPVLSSLATMLRGTLLILTAWAMQIRFVLDMLNRAIGLARTFASVLPAPARRALAQGPIGGALFGGGAEGEPGKTLGIQTGGEARVRAGETIAEGVRETRAERAAREERAVNVQQDIIDALRAQEGGVFRINVNMDGRQVAEHMGRLERSERAARGGPVEGDQ